jgi:diguanylate cyclase (GGDEF)-like protein
MTPGEVEPPRLTDATAAARQLHAGFPWLRFEPELEREFRLETTAARLPQVRINLLLALALVVAFGAMNALVLDSSERAALHWVQFGGLLPLVIAGLASTYLPGAPRLYPRFAIVLGPLACLLTVVIDVLASRAGTELLFSTVVLATIFAYYLIGLLFYAATLTNLLVLVAYFCAALLGDLPRTLVAYNTLVLFFANLIGALVAYSVESVLRTHFLEARLLAEAAARDGLTGIYNRRRFDEQLENVWQHAMRERAPVALLLVDIDFFKAYNDRYGHQAGDEVLRRVATALIRAARRPLDCVARYGGEEFAILLYEPTREHVAELVLQIQSGVSQLAIVHDGSQVSARLTVSLGIAYVVPGPGRSTRGFVQLADEALYEAKEQGRNKAVFRELEYDELVTGSFRSKVKPAP